MTSSEHDRGRESARPRLHMEDLSKRFRNTIALDRASLTVDPGEIHALIGQNGAGKSTLLKILTGVHRRDSGLIQIDGKGVDFGSTAAAQAGGIATIYQEVNLVPQLSVAENLYLGRFPRRLGLLDWKAMKTGAERALAQLDIDIDVTRPLNSYRVATQQMTAIARALSLNARLLVMDEPTSSLADKEVETLFGVMRSLQTRDVSMIFVSHRMDELFEVCESVTVLRDGTTVLRDSLQNVDRHALVMAMLGRAAAVVDRGARRTERESRGTATLSVTDLASAPRVRDASLAVQPGRVLGLTGLLGSGRSELLQAIFGAAPLDAGTVSVAGESAKISSPRDAIANGIAYLPEDRRAEGIIPTLSVRENLTLALLPKLTRWGIIKRAEQRKLVDDFITRLGIKARPEQLITQLSGGNQQKVLLARWLAVQPDVLLLDEPTRGIDVNAKAEILKVIDDLAAEGLAVLLVSSELEEVISSSDEVVVMREGTTVDHVPLHELAEERLISAMAVGSTVELETIP